MASNVNDYNYRNKCTQIVRTKNLSMDDGKAITDAVEVNVKADEVYNNNKAKKSTRRNLRKRIAQDEEGNEENGPSGITAGSGTAAHRDKRTTDNKARPSTFTFSTKMQKGDDEDNGLSNRANGGVGGGGLQFESSDAVQIRDDGGATRALELEEAKVDSKGNIGKGEGKGGDDPSLYRGMAGYKDYRQGFRRESSTVHGPLRAPTNLRMSIRVDYQPDVCKDYKETGYCGFGDACKFLHDRGDYKAGWELDRDWEQQQKAQRDRLAAAEAKMIDKDGAGNEEEGEDDDDDLPFACFICRRPWAEGQDPVVTRCKHYFCEQCALKHNAKSKKCFVCNQPTGGIFNVAHDILKREKRK